jgi:REP element-mobilizing transposase RayT
MARGIDGRPIFRADTDRYKLLSLLEENVQKSGYLLYAWSFMDNHYHLAIRVNNYPLKKFLSSINGPYAQFFRKKIKTRGSLFQDRPKSVPCQDQKYLQELIRYVHLNPLRAGVVKSLRRLKTYRWTGHSVLMGTIDFAAQNCSDVLRFFSNETSIARLAYERFCLQGVESNDDSIDSKLAKVNKEIDDAHDSSCFVIGNPKYVQKVLKESKEIQNRLAHAAIDTITIDDIIKRVCDYFQLEESDLLKKGRGNVISQAKESVSILAHRHYQIPVIQIARRLHISSQAVSKMLKKEIGTDIPLC